MTATEIAQLRATIADLEDTIRQLRAEIIAADSAYNLNGRISTWEETVGLVRMCHEGRHAMDELAWLHDAQSGTNAAAQLGMIRP